MRYKSAWTLGGDNMNKKGSAPVYIAVVMALVFIGIVFTLVTSSTNSTPVSDTLTGVIVNVNETLTYDDLDAVTSVSNGTVTLNTGDYAYSTTGQFRLLNATYNASDLTVAYSYYDVGYVDSSTARLVVLLIPVLFAVGIMYLVLKK